MADLDFNKIVSDSLALTKTQVGAAFKKVKPFAEHEFQQFAESALFLAKLKLQGAIDEDELKSRLELQKLAATNVLLAVQGIGLVTAQNIINGVLGIISEAIKKAIKVALPI